MPNVQYPHRRYKPFDLIEYLPCFSDYLYFLPPRQEVDNARTLRLISSAAHPHHRPALDNRIHGRRSMRGWNVHDSWVSHLGESLIPSVAVYVGSGARWGGQLVADSDHYEALPLSDGFHILFLDPESGELSVGTDAPLGGPRRLMRKIRLLPPQDVGRLVPQVYAATSHYAAEVDRLSVRIVAAYDGTLVLFSIPKDVLELSRIETVPITGAGTGIGPARAARKEWLDW